MAAVNDDKSNQTAPVGGIEAKSPADRVRQIQELQRAMEAAPAASAPPAPVAVAPPAVAATALGDAFAVAAAQALKPVLKEEKVDPRQHATYGRVQADVSSLFGGKNGVELKGEPWKIISFLDAAPALFEPKQPLANYEPLVPKQGVVTREGVLFEVGLKAKDGSEPVQTKKVLVGQDGQLRGAECKSPGDLNRLLNAPGFFERLLGARPAQGWQAKESTAARFEVKVPGAKSETVYFNNFGLKVPPSNSRSTHDFIANYHLDQFGAAI